MYLYVYVYNAFVMLAPKYYPLYGILEEGYKTL